MQGLFSRVPAAAKAVKPRLYAAIDRATSQHLSAPNLAVNAEVASTIVTALDPSYASTKACKRLCIRIRTRNQRVQFLALHVLQECVRTCGAPFHTELARSELFSELSRMADRSLWCSTDIQRLILALIQEWAYEIREHKFSAEFNRLKRLNMPFEPRGAGVDARLQPYPGYDPQMHAVSQGGYLGNGAHGHGGGLHPARNNPVGHPQQHSITTSGSGQLGADLLKPGKTRDQLLSDIETARGTVALLNEVLDGIEKDRIWSKVKEEYCGEVAGATASVSQRLQNLLGSNINDERVIASALSVNDEAQRALDRRLEYFEISEGKRAAPPPRALSASHAEQPEITQPSSEKRQTESSKKQESPLLDLLSLDVESPPLASSDVATSSDPFHSNSDKDKIEPIAPPAPIEAPPMNNPFAAPYSIQNQSESQGTDAQGIQKEGQKTDSNPFMNDEAFAKTAPSIPAAVTSQNKTQESSLYPKIDHDLPVSSGGNPFAPSAPTPPGTSMNNDVAAYQLQRPPPVVLPTPQMIPNQGPLTAPAMSNAPYGFGPSSTGSHESQQSQTTTGAGAASFQGFSNAAYPNIINAMGVSSSLGSGKKGEDAFSGLVSLTPKREEAPPPPK